MLLLQSVSNNVSNKKIIKYDYSPQKLYTYYKISNIYIITKKKQMPNI